MYINGHGSCPSCGYCSRCGRGGHGNYYQPFSAPNISGGQFPGNQAFGSGQNFDELLKRFATDKANEPKK